MIKSMTGFGRISQEDDKSKISIELRCLNSKQLDFSFRSSGALRDRETEIRAAVSKVLQRGNSITKGLKIIKEAYILRHFTVELERV